ncbi:hypothetical protein JX265_011399 [Neoarthrinium moseri]|uniref:RING-type domain-containing protein n=1 Tax=Neoarthrinium moseri TaxID=1658444 RepID=A0A9Q0AJG3_9PEZI|nr:hypothetical protein JX266_001824 [Neoarthrinium moseri]KAI1856758.1 hypothetical protein JX265_011399 [Neoarthrinium moseri]
MADLDERNAVSDLDQVSCKEGVLLIFEDICPKYLDELAQQHAFNADAIIATILDQQERDILYPRRQKSRKRKRGEDVDDEDEEKKSVDPNTEIQAKLNDHQHLRTMSSAKYKDMAALLLSQDFPLIPKMTLRSKLLSQNGSSLFRAYAAIDDALRKGDEGRIPWSNKKTRTKPLEQYTAANIGKVNREDLTDEQTAALDEFLAARQVRARKDAEAAVEAAEVSNLERARQTGQTAECGCCFEECPLNRMVCCENAEGHWFCRGCMRQHAENTIGYSKYELKCMSMDGCSAGFSVAQRKLFLDKKLQIALDRIEAQAMLEKAGIEDLETCPFCPMAIEYPPVHENKEFRCTNRECEIVSCRLCRKQTHIPKTCAEAAAEEEHSARHTIEEAMSEAVIRKCNKCANPYIKSDGCNKIFCTKCSTIQCYVCRQTVKDYSHFNDQNRGGKQGQCPLFDSTEARHQEEAQRAENATRDRVARENPEMDNEALKLKMSARVEEDERKRKEQGERQRARVHFAPPAFFQALNPGPAPEIADDGRARQLNARQLQQIEAQVQRAREHRERLQEQQEARHKTILDKIRAAQQHHQNHVAEQQRLQQEAVQRNVDAMRQAHETRAQELLDLVTEQTRNRARQEQILRREEQPMIQLPFLQVQAPANIGVPGPIRNAGRIPNSGRTAANAIVVDPDSPPQSRSVREGLRNDNVFMPLRLGADLSFLGRPQSMQDVLDNQRQRGHRAMFGGGLEQFNRFRGEFAQNALGLQARPPALPDLVRLDMFPGAARIGDGVRVQRVINANARPAPANQVGDARV